MGGWDGSRADWDAPASCVGEFAGNRRGYVVQGGGGGCLPGISVADYRVLLADYVVEVTGDGTIAAFDNVIVSEYGISRPDDSVVVPDDDVPVADDCAVAAYDAPVVHCDEGVVCMCPRLHCGIM